MQRRSFLNSIIEAVVALCGVKAIKDADPADLTWGSGTADLRGAPLTPARVTASGFGFVIPAGATVTAIRIQGVEVPRELLPQTNSNETILKIVARGEREPTRRLGMDVRTRVAAKIR